jgi:hypothetical protein
LGGREGEVYSVVSPHVVPVTAAGFTVVLARNWRISRFAGLARAVVAERAMREKITVEVYISAVVWLFVL